MVATIGTGMSWLVDDLLRVEQLLLDTAGSSLHPLVSESSTHLIRAGGKRLRPSLVLVCSRAGEAGRRETDLAAAAVELIHLATLYHDDVIDETETRRGAPTVHSKWGVEVAVLAGDYLFAHGSALGAEAGHEVPSILARAVADVCEGQIVETAALSEPRRGVDHYLKTIAGKTGALFRASCEMGATTSDASPEARAALAEYGSHLGLAFQIVDDLLDLIGDPAVTGKVPGHRPQGRRVHAPGPHRGRTGRVPGGRLWIGARSSSIRSSRRSRRPGLSRPPEMPPPTTGVPPRKPLAGPGPGTGKRAWRPSSRASWPSYRLVEGRRTELGLTARRRSCLL